MRFLFLIFFLVACGGKLTESERKKLHEGMSTQDIRRVSDAELQEAALAYGDRVLSGIRNDKAFTKSTRDSLAGLYHVRIYSMTPDNDRLREIEKQLVDAYLAGAEPGKNADNIQKTGVDSLLFTRPVFKEGTDGSLRFSHAIAVMMPVKEVVLTIPEP